MSNPSKRMLREIKGQTWDISEVEARAHLTVEQEGAQGRAGRDFLPLLTWRPPETRTQQKGPVWKWGCGHGV